MNNQILISSLGKVVLLLVAYLTLTGCSEYEGLEQLKEANSNQMIAEEITGDDVETAANSIPLNQNKLTSHCTESGATNFDPTNLAYLTDPNQTFNYQLNRQYGNHDNDADGTIDTDTNGDGKGDTDGYRNRRVFDIFYHKSGGPRPLVIHFHGGGFAGGDKCLSYNYRKMPVKEILAAGGAFLTANYRLLGYYDNNNQPNVYQTNKGVITALKDGRRLIQFIRSKAAQYNIDKNRILVFGESAGAGIALWNAVGDDFQNLRSTSAVARQSSKPNAVMAIGPQATYDFARWETDIFHQGSNYLYTRWRYAQYAVNQNGYKSNYEFPDCNYRNFYNEIIDCEDPYRPISKAKVNFYESMSGFKVVLGYTGSGEPAAEPDTPLYQQYLNETANYRAKVDMIRMFSADDPIMYIESLDTPDNVSVPTTGVMYHSKFHAIALSYMANLFGIQNQLQVGYQRGLNQRQLRFNFMNAHILQ